MDKAFWHGKRVLLTGHTGFKGSWLSMVLLRLGAQVSGFALSPNTDPSLFSLCGLEKEMFSHIGDIRDKTALEKVFAKERPEVVFHMAAQPIVRESYKHPVYTYETNVMGTVHVLECVRNTDSVRSFLNVTTDKVYHNNEWAWGYRETDTLGGFDPYSNSKACSELVTQSYRDAFLSNQGIPASTARAGNVIGGGDFAKDRIIPDCVRAAMAGIPIEIRNPYSTRPYQHVLEPLFAYLTIAQAQWEDGPAYQGSYNIGPDEMDCVTTRDLVSMFCELWGEGMQWRIINEAQTPHEAHFLALDCAQVKTQFHWRPRWHIREAIGQTVDWTKDYLAGKDISVTMDAQIATYLAGQ